MSFSRDVLTLLTELTDEIHSAIGYSQCIERLLRQPKPDVEQAISWALFAESTLLRQAVAVRDLRYHAHDLVAIEEEEEEEAQRLPSYEPAWWSDEEDEETRRRFAEQDEKDDEAFREAVERISR